MPISVVVGGQYGSEGKGKVALELVRRDPAITVVVRPGGTNSGHTGYSNTGERLVVRQLPAAAIDRNVITVLPAGSYIDVALFEAERRRLSLSPSQIIIDPRAHVIREDHIRWESAAGLTATIGSTGSGTGAAVLSRLARFAPGIPVASPASEVAELTPYLRDAASFVAERLERGERVLVEGTQGFGLSPLHGDAWPKATSRDTTAAAFLAEGGLSPLAVDEIILVLRCHPIRVAGDSGPMVGETSWDAIRIDSGSQSPLEEFTSVTGRLRRVGHFDPALVRQAIRANQPTRIVLNHLDYVDSSIRNGSKLTARAREFIEDVGRGIGREINYYGTGPANLFEFHNCLESAL